MDVASSSRNTASPVTTTGLPSIEPKACPVFAASTPSALNTTPMPMM